MVPCLQHMKKFLISPPFGNFISHKNFTSIYGTFTLYKRGSVFTKLYKGLKTVRPVNGGWVNDIGLQNGGILSIKKFSFSKIYSIIALQKGEWDNLMDIIPEDTQLELNLSCPNLTTDIEISDKQVKAYVLKYPLVIFKLSPTEDIHRQIEKLISLGVKNLHLCNTLPVEKGGISGKQLKNLSLEIIKKTRLKYPNVTIIGGGGIYSINDVNQYKNAGANYFSTASIWLNPIKTFKLLQGI